MVFSVGIKGKSVLWQIVKAVQFLRWTPLSGMFLFRQIPFGCSNTKVTLFSLDCCGLYFFFLEQCLPLFQNRESNLPEGLILKILILIKWTEQSTPQYTFYWDHYWLTLYIHTHRHFGKKCTHPQLETQETHLIYPLFPNANAISTMTLAHLSSFYYKVAPTFLH